MQLDSAFVTLALLVLLALAFDFMNGFHDAANSIATVVSTRVLKPYQAVVWAAFFNFAAMWLFEPKVAATIGKGIVSPGVVDNALIFGALIGAITWNIVTWYYGIPSSSSHALIGGLIGAAMAKAGFAPLLAPGIIRTAVFIVVSPVLGMFIGGLLMLMISWTCFRIAPSRLDRWFRRTQLVSSALYSIGHGSNDAQKTMGIIWLLLMSRGLASPDHLPSLGHRQLLHRDCHRHAVRWLAHHPHHGAEADAPDSGQRHGGVAGRRDHVVHRFGIRHPGVDHAYHHRRHPRAPEPCRIRRG